MKEVVFSPAEQSAQHFRTLEWYKQRHDKLVTQLAELQGKEGAEYNIIEPRKRWLPNTQDLLRLYPKAQLRITYPDKDVVNVREWWCTSTMIWSQPEENDKGYTIEMYLEGEYAFKGKIQFKLRDCTELPVPVKADYYARCKKIHIRKEVILIDTPESLLWALDNCVDMYDLIPRGLAIKI